jgi:hypothetical protein
MPPGTLGFLARKQGQHLVPHQVHCLGDGADIGARLEAIDAAFENGSHIFAGQDFPLDQALKQREHRHAIRHCNALRAAT